MNNRIASEIDQGAGNQRRAWAWDAILPSSAASILPTMSTIAGCAIISQTRSVHLLKSGVPRELHDGDTVVTGDRIRTPIQTSENAHLYLALCAHQELAVYPSQSGIQIWAGELVIVPQAGAELVVGDHPGPQVLYVIVSRTEIAIADPRLAHELAAKGPGGLPMDCGTNLDATLAKPPSPLGPARPRTPGSPNVIPKEVSRRPLSSTPARKQHRSPKDPTTIAPSAGAASSVTNRDPVQTVSSPSSGNEPRIPEFELK